VTKSRSGPFLNRDARLRGQAPTTSNSLSSALDQFYPRSRVISLILTGRDTALIGLAASKAMQDAD
jgi:hypothetical protein